MSSSLSIHRKTRRRETTVLVQGPQLIVLTRTDSHKDAAYKFESYITVLHWCQEIIPIFSLVNDLSKTKKNNVFDKSETLQHSTSQGIYSSGCIENVSANPLIVSIFIDVMSSSFKACKPKINREGTVIQKWKYTLRYNKIVQIIM